MLSTQNQDWYGHEVVAAHFPILVGDRHMTKVMYSALDYLTPADLESAALGQLLLS